MPFQLQVCDKDVVGNGVAQYCSGRRMPAGERWRQDGDRMAGWQDLVQHDGLGSLLGLRFADDIFPVRFH